MHSDVFAPVGRAVHVLPTEVHTSSQLSPSAPTRHSFPSPPQAASAVGGLVGSGDGLGGNGVGGDGLGSDGLGGGGLGGGGGGEGPSQGHTRSRDGWEDEHEKVEIDESG